MVLVMVDNPKRYIKQRRGRGGGCGSLCKGVGVQVEFPRSRLTLAVWPSSVPHVSFVTIDSFTPDWRSQQ
jgi:hypothetical protein